jgi:hypothetical protein
MVMFFVLPISVSSETDLKLLIEQVDSSLELIGGMNIWN